MPSFHNAFPSKYMKVSDLNGKAIVVTISGVEFETVVTDNKLVARFNEGGVKPVVLNKTNCEAVAGIAGSDDYLDWSGHKVEIFPSSTEYQGKRVPCIRIRAPRQPKPARQAAPPPTPPRRPSAKAAPDPDDVDEAMPTTDGGEY